ncbi:dynein light chain Dlc1 [Schizosaccharomyces japonicus yFS275]|uniref:Dynein light chain Dlc1 n=1 Tax=Schizosaccharomyces japonicus (strain yFS275 / FY16936) TaxID=402676 RepID=B6K0H7_SCHJY|nr:dynein light chain Dlc1 [Schizosaccharomyces japonicus yFS275]EEB06327.1 dynein light chain Dlc1 [Schizosaccharomyces japonicus yFS275]
MSCPLSREKIDAICSEAVTSLLKEPVYEHDTILKLNKEAIRFVLSALNKDASSYKWIVNSTVVQKLPAGHPTAGVTASQAASWDCERDGFLVVKKSSPVVGITLTITFVSF